MSPQSHSLSEYLRLLLRQSGTSLESQSSPWKGGISHSSFVGAWLLIDFSVLKSLFLPQYLITDNPMVYLNISQIIVETKWDLLTKWLGSLKLMFLNKFIFLKELET